MSYRDSAASTPATSPPCQAVWNWSSNTMGQDACEMASIMIDTACSNGQAEITYTLDERTSPWFKPYPPLEVGQAVSGLCTVPAYNLIQMCAACQSLDPNSIPWWSYTSNCASTRFKVPPPNGTQFPSWVYTDPTAQDGHFNFSSVYTTTTGKSFTTYSEWLAALMAQAVNLNASPSSAAASASNQVAAAAATSSSTNSPPPPPQHTSNGGHKTLIAVLAAVGAVVLLLVFCLGILVGSCIRRRRRKDRLGVKLGSGSQILPPGSEDGLGPSEAEYKNVVDMIETRTTMASRGDVARSNAEQDPDSLYRARSSMSGTNSISTHAHSFASYLAKRRRSSIGSLDSRTSSAPSGSDWYSSSLATTSYPSSARRAPRDNVVHLTRERGNESLPNVADGDDASSLLTTSDSRLVVDPFEDGSDLISLTPSHDAPSSTGASYGRSSGRSRS